MESYKREEGIFHLGIDETARAYMLETSRWAKFLALIGLILTGMLSIGLVVAWQLFKYVFDPVFLAAVNILYPGRGYG